MDLTRSLVEEKAKEYTEQEPLYAVEEQHVDMLPETFRSGEFGRRDAEWVVQWYFRRYLGAYPDAERRATEEAFADNDFEAVRSAILDAAEAEGVAESVDPLISLDGVDVPVASAFLFFLDPENYVVIGDREWSVLRKAGELADPYPDPVSTDDYERYLEACRSLADRLECDLWTLYRAVWRLAKERGEV